MDFVPNVSSSAPAKLPSDANVSCVATCQTQTDDDDDDDDDDDGQIDNKKYTSTPTQHAHAVMMSRCGELSGGSESDNELQQNS